MARERENLQIKLGQGQVRGQDRQSGKGPHFAQELVL